MSHRQFDRYVPMVTLYAVRAIGHQTAVHFSFIPYSFILFLWRFDPIVGHGLPLRVFTITLRHTTLGRTPLDEWSAWLRDIYLTKHNTHHRQTSMPSGGIRTHNLSRWAAADPRLRPLGHCDRLLYHVVLKIKSGYFTVMNETLWLVLEFSTFYAALQLSS